MARATVTTAAPIAPSARAAGAWVLAIALICVGQWLMLRPTSLALSFVIWVAGLGLFVWLQWPTAAPPAAVSLPVSEGRPGMSRLVPLAVAVGAGLSVWVRARGRSEGADWTDVIMLWLGSIVAVIAAAWPQRISGVARRSLLARAGAALGRDGPLLAAVLVVAVATRMIALDRFPVVEGDGMSLTLLGRDVTQGRLTDPFSSAFFDNPTLYPFMQSGVMRVVGETLFAARLLSAIIGSLTVLVTYLWCRRAFGSRVALIAAALLAVLPIHLYFSRISLNLAEDSLFLVLVLWLVDRAVVDGRRLDAALAGVALGVSQYFYFGARLLPLLAVVVLAWYALWWRWQGEAWRPTLRRVGASAVWIALAAALVFAPQAAHYADQPEDLTSRYRTVAFFGPGLDAAVEQTGGSTVEVVSDQAVRAALLPFATPPNGHFHPHPPLIGLPVALLTALGLAVSTAWIRRRGYAAVALAWWLSLAGVGLTVGLHSQRWAIAYPLVAVMVAIGLEAAWRVLEQRLLVPARWAVAVCTSILLAVMAWCLLFFFRDENTLAVWSDGNSVVADEFADALQDEPAGTAVYTAFSPRMSFTSHATVPFLANHVTGVELEEPLTTAAAVPPVVGHTLFAFLPERLGELDVVRAAYPGGTQAEARARGQLLFVTYAVDPG